MADQFFGGAVQDADLAVAVDADDAGAGRGQHGFDKAAAAVDHLAGAHQIVALRPQFLRHLVEGLAEMREIALRALDRHLHMKIAGRDELAAPISRRIGATSQLAKFSPISTDDIRTVSAITVNISAKAT
jgi:hypothetical protein